MKKKYVKSFLKKTDYNDILVREAVIKIVKEAFNIDAFSNTDDKYGIDLLVVNGNGMGIEVEQGGWKGNYWGDSNYSNKTNLGFQTLNIPLRKDHFWMEYYLDEKDVTRHTPGYLTNLFIRTNTDFTQFILVRPETIFDRKKVHRNRFLASNSTQIENWLSYKKEDVETYNLIEGIWTLQK